MPNPLLKILGVSGGLATVGGGATVIYLTSNSTKKEETTASEKTPEKKTIISLLKGKKLLTKAKGDNAKWLSQWEAFKKEYDQKEPQAPWELPDWKEVKAIEGTIDTFKEQCEKHSKNLVTDEQDTIFVAVSTYCTEKEVT